MTAKHAIIEILATLRRRKVINDDDMHAIYIALERKEKGAS